MNHRVAVNGLRVSWILATIWYELGIFFSSVRHCNWPDSALSTSLAQGDSPPSHVLLIADPQILDHRSYPERGPYLTYLTRVVVDLNLRKNWWAALLKRPDAIVFLGDMMDGGRFNMSDDEYEQYYRRFQSIFSIPSGVPTYFIPGNHDIGSGFTSFICSSSYLYLLSVIASEPQHHSPPMHVPDTFPTLAHLIVSLQSRIIPLCSWMRQVSLKRIWNV